MDFEQDITEQVIAELPHDNADRGKLLAMGFNGLLIQYFNWRDRFIPPVPRQVHWSAALRANPLSTDPRYTAALEQIAADVAAGADLQPHLSRQVRKGFVDKPGLSRQDLDLLLNDWDVHHLHLSTELQPDGFIARTEHVLFAIFRSSDAFFIDIFPHKTSWAEERVLKRLFQ